MTAVINLYAVQQVWDEGHSLVDGRESGGLLELILLAVLMMAWWVVHGMSRERRQR